MPLVEPTPGLAYNPFVPEKVDRQRPGFAEAIGPAFRLENDIYAAAQLMARPVFQPDEDFDLQGAVAGSKFRYDYPDNLGRAQSQEEFDFIEGRIARELRDKQTLASSGGAGVVAGVMAGTISPTILVPGLGPAKGAKGVLQAGLLAAGAAGAQEAFLLGEQETRTGEEAAISVAASTVIGGLLGSASIYMSARAARRVESDMDGSIIEEAISYGSGEGSFGPVRTPPRSPRSSNPELPTYTRGTTREGDSVVVYTPDGRTQMAVVDAIDSEGGVTFKNQNEEFVAGDINVSLTDPRAPNAKLVTDTSVAKGDVGKFTNEQLVAKADELEQGIATLKAEGRLADMEIRDRTALLAESLRRVESDPGLDIPSAQALAEAAETPAAPRPAGEEPSAVPDPAEPQPKSLSELADEAEQLPDAPPMREADAPDGRAIGAAETSPRAQQQLARRGPISGWVLDQMARLSPVTRVIAQKQSPVASAWMARLSDAGLKTEGNLGVDAEDGMHFLVHAPEGTVESRAQMHQAAVGQFVQEYDDAYARHVMGDVGDPEELKSAFRAHLASGFRNLPEGKMSREEFGAKVYELGSTGEEISDPTVMKAVAAQHRLFDYFKAVAQEAHQRRLEINPDARPMFDPEGNLGPDVFNYIHQVYDTEKIAGNSGEFKLAISNHHREILDKSFRKQWSQTQNDIAEMAQKEAEARLSESGLAQTLRRIDGEERAIVNDPEFVEYQNGLDDIDLRLREAEPEDQPAIRKEGQDYQMNRSDRIQSLQRKERRLAAERGRIEELQGMDEAGRAERAQAWRILQEEREDAFDTDWREKGAVDLNVDNGTADFREAGDEAAELLYNRMVGLGTRASGMEILGGARGAELTRSLNLPFEEKMKWLNTDPEHTVRVYARHMSADVELYRATGSVNGAPMFDEVIEDFNRARTRMEQEGASEKAMRDLNAQQNQTESDLRVVVERLRHQRGLPENADGIGYRLGRAALDVNVMRLMGNVVLSSVPDLARPVMRSGFQRTFRGWQQMAGGLINLNASGRELRRVGIAWDPVMHNRTQAIFEMLDDNQGRKTGIERGIGFLSNKTGLVAGFDFWTSRMKLVSGSVAASEFSHAIRGIAEGTADRRSRELLAAHGIDDAMANRIWDQFNIPGGSSDMVDGNRLPNMENWDDYRSMAAYRAALIKFVDDTIVTPGVDRPAWMDANIGFKLLAQFRSFTFASTQRVVMAGLQEQDRNIASGIAFSLAMGAVSYYTYAASVGGDVWEEAQKMDAGKWADEAIDRSGLLGVFSLGLDAAHNVPGLAPYTSFSGQRTTRRSARSAMSAIVGPSYGLAENIINVIQGIDEPTQSTLNNARKIVPYQNVFYIRQLLDTIVEAAGDAFDIPERRN